MKYALLIYSSLSADEYGAVLDASRQADDTDGPWVKYTRAARDAGVFVAAEQLTHDDTATSLRHQDGERMITDGPYMETKEHLLGFYLFEVDDLDAALDWAKRMPTHPGQTIEVRAALTGLPWHRALVD